MAIMHGQAFHSPVDREKVQVALDIGCGTGVMTFLMARHFPNATIYGIDLSPVPETTRLEAERYNGRVKFIEGNVFNMIDEHPALQSGTVDFIYHRLLSAALKSYHTYLHQVVCPLLKPGGVVEMHDFVGPSWYHSDPCQPGSARCVSDDWLWIKPLMSAFNRQDPFDKVYLTLQILDFQDVGQKLYQMPWAPVEGQPEAEQWARYAPDGIADAFATSLPKILDEAELQRLGPEKLETSIRETIGKPTKGLWIPFLVAWGRKPN